MTTALLTPLMMALGGGAIDISRAMSTRIMLNDAADSALLAAVNRAQTAYNAGAADWITQGQTLGQSYFAANTANAGLLANVSYSTNLQLQGSTITGTLNYSGSVRNLFLPLLGVSTTNASGSVKVAVPTTLYANIYILIDNSASMGIGASTTDQQTLTAALGCAFACHYTNIYGQVDNVAQARATGAVLRIDIVKQALSQALTNLSALNIHSQIKVALYTFSNQITNIYNLSSDVASALPAVGGIDMASANSSGGTNITYALNQLSSQLATTGDGSSSASPLGFVVLATDAVQNSWDMTYYNGSSIPFQVVTDPNFAYTNPNQAFPAALNTPILEGIDPAQCSPIKSKGYTMMTLDMQYIVPSGTPSNDPKAAMFTYIQNTLAPSITANMSSCASGVANAYSASTPAQIISAFNAIFASTTQKLRLTQ